MGMHACMLYHCSHVWLFATPWTVAHQVPLSMGFSRQVHWNGLLCLPPEDLPHPGIELFSCLLCLPALAGIFFTPSATWGAPLQAYLILLHFGFPGSANVKEPTCQFRRCQKLGFHPWVGKSPWRRAWKPASVFFPGESHGKRSLVGYSP